MRRLPHFVLVAASALALMPRVASAQEDPRKVQAESMFADGLKLHDASRDADALVKYRQAYATYPTPNILFAIARVEQVLGQSLAAIEHFRAAMKSPLLHRRNQELGKGYVAELEGKLARVILIGPAGLRVLLAGKEHRLPLDGVVDVEPGPVDVRADLDGRAYAGRVETLAGTQAILELKPVQSTPTNVDPVGHGGPAVVVVPPPVGAEASFWTTRHTIGVVAGGVAVIAAGAGGAFLLAREGHVSDGKDAVASNARPCAQPADAACAKYDAARDGIKSTELGAAISIAAFVALGATAAVLLLWPSPNRGAKLRVLPVGRDLSMVGTF